MKLFNLKNISWLCVVGFFLFQNTNIHATPQRNAAIGLIALTLLLTWDYCRTSPKKILPKCTNTSTLGKLYYYYQWNIRGHRGTPRRIEQEIRIDENTVQYKYSKVHPRGMGKIVKNYKAFMLALTLPIAINALADGINNYEKAFTIFGKKLGLINEQ